MTRILVTGSRDWDDVDAIWNALDDANPRVVVHGACPTGADRIADAWCVAHGIKAERFPADWKQYGKRAGFIRNAEMVNNGADLCLAFIKNKSKGASDTARLAAHKGIPVRRWTK